MIREDEVTVRTRPNGGFIVEGAGGRFLFKFHPFVEPAELIRQIVQIANRFYELGKAAR